MNFTRTEEQRLIEASAADWLTANYDFRARERGVHRDGGDPAAWHSYAELGWLGMPLPAAHGGLAMGSVDCGVLMYALGRHLVVEPVHSTVHEAACLLADAGSPEQVEQWLPGVIDGSHRLALAHVEDSQSLPWSAPALRATKTASGWLLAGTKRAVAGGPNARRWIVSAITETGDVQLFLIDPATAQVHSNGFDTTDGRRAADAVLDNIAVPEDARLPSLRDDSAAGLRRALARATLMRCWEAAGLMQAAVDQTVAYTQERHQFGHAISEFQVVQHRLAEMAVHAAEALAACELASMRADLVDVSCDAASMARIKVVTGAQYIAKEAVQLHGAMGVCEELPIAATFRQLLAFCHVDGLSGRHAVSRGRQFLKNRAHENSQTL